MRDTLEKLTLVRNYTINEETKEVEVFINDEDYYYKYQIERMLYLLDKSYNYKINLI